MTMIRLIEKMLRIFDPDVTKPKRHKTIIVCWKPERVKYVLLDDEPKGQKSVDPVHVLCLYRIPLSHCRLC